MPFREKTAWISLISMAGIYGLYFWSLIRSGRHNDAHVSGLLGTIIALVVVQIVLTIAVAIFDPTDANTPPDERDQLIELKSTSLAYSGLSTGIAFAIFFAAVPSSDHLRREFAAVHSGGDGDRALQLPDHPVPAERVTWPPSATKSVACASSTAR